MFDTCITIFNVAIVLSMPIQVDLCGVAKILRTPVAALIPKVILYVQTKDMSWRLYSHLLSEGVSRGTIDIYHASLTPETKSRVYREFRSSSSPLKCLIATVAFGMVRLTLLLYYDSFYQVYCNKGHGYS